MVIMRHTVQIYDTKKVVVADIYCITDHISLYVLRGNLKESANISM